MQRDVVQIIRSVSDLLPHRWEYLVACPHGGVSRLGNLDEEQRVFQEICALHAALTGCPCDRPYLGIDDMAVAERGSSDHQPLERPVWWE